MKSCHYCGSQLPQDTPFSDFEGNPLCGECYESFQDFVSDEAAEGEREERQWSQYRYDMEITQDGYPSPFSFFA